MKQIVNIVEELRAEIKRRNELAKEEQKKQLRCRNCTHCVPNPRFPQMFNCDARTWGKKIVRNYCVKKSTKACDKFESKYESEQSTTVYL